MNKLFQPIGFISPTNGTRHFFSQSPINPVQRDEAIETRFEPAKLDMSNYHPQLFDTEPHPLFRQQELGNGLPKNQSSSSKLSAEPVTEESVLLILQ
ncbi:MAG: hypothetical protein ABIE74_13155 [Pseudomonadota bacterium]